MATRYAAFTELTTMNSNLTTQMGQEEGHIRLLQVEIFNLKVAASAQTTGGRGASKVGGHSNI